MIIYLVGIVQEVVVLPEVKVVMLATELPLEGAALVSPFGL